MNKQDTMSRHANKQIHCFFGYLLNESSNEIHKHRKLFDTRPDRRYGTARNRIATLRQIMTSKFNYGCVKEHIRLHVG